MAVLLLPVVLTTERRRTGGRVVGAGCVVTQRSTDRWPCCGSPVVLLRSALKPVAVLLTAGGVAEGAHHRRWPC